MKVKTEYIALAELDLNVVGLCVNRATQLDCIKLN